MNDTVTGIWSSLVRLAGSGDGAFSSFLTSTAPPNLLGSSAPMKPPDYKGRIYISMWI